MISIRELINRIRFDKSLKQEEYEFFYEDRISKKKICFGFDDIHEFGNFLLVKINDKEIELPLHRIKQAKRNGKLVWERQ